LRVYGVIDRCRYLLYFSICIDETCRIWYYRNIMNSNRNQLTKEKAFFLVPEKALHRQYESLRAYFVDELPSKEVAERFGYTPGSFRVLCSQFRSDPNLQDRFFKDVERGPQSASKRDPVRELVISLRKKNLSVYDIQRELAERGHQLSINALSILLKEEGFARLPRRRDEERPETLKPHQAATADVRLLNLAPQSFNTDAAGLFLFVPLLLKTELMEIIEKVRLPGSSMIPATAAVRTLLGLKLLGKERTSHVMEMIFDPGIALFAGLNVVPKRSFLAEYSNRVDPRKNVKLMSLWLEALHNVGLKPGTSFDLDFHAVPTNTSVEPLEKHYITNRSRSQKAVLTFLARDIKENLLCYGNAGVTKEQRPNEILRFAQWWKEMTGSYPQELVFDSQLTTYTIMNKLHELGINFITLRRRSKKMLSEIFGAPASSWQRIKLPALTRCYQTPRIMEKMVKIKDYKEPIRQITVIELGHEDPTILLTNQLKASAVQLITRYAQCMIIENGIAEAINFFHLDALSSMVGLKVDFDLQMTLIAGSLYRLMSKNIGREYGRSTAKTLFRKIFDLPGKVTIDENTITVQFARKAHNPFLLAAGFADEQVQVPWLGNKHLSFVFD